MNLFSVLEGFAHNIVDFLSNIQDVFFGTLDSAILVMFDTINTADPLYSVKYLYESMKVLNDVINNTLGVNLLFFLDFSLGMFLLPAVIFVLIAVLFIVAVWKLILGLIPFA